MWNKRRTLHFATTIQTVKLAPKEHAYGKAKAPRISKQDELLENALAILKQSQVCKEETVEDSSDICGRYVANELNSGQNLKFKRFCSTPNFLVILEVLHIQCKVEINKHILLKVPHLNHPVMLT